MEVTKAIEFRKVGVAYPAAYAPSLKALVTGGLGKNRHKPPFWALRGVTFSVEPGESIGVVGENGAGKSTLLRVAAGIIPPAAGEVIVRGSVAPLIELGTGFDVELTGRENVLFNGALLGKSRATMEARLDEIVEFAGLSESIDAPLRTYSTGMVARLAFSIATTVDAQIVLLDEILSVGDAQFRGRCEERIRRYYESGATVVLVSHDLSSVRDLCARSIWVREGRVFADGPTSEVIGEYLAFLRGGKVEPRKPGSGESGPRLEPSSAPLGASVVVRGSGFDQAIRATIGGEQCRIESREPNAVCIIVPPLLTGGVYDVVVEWEGGSARMEKAFLAQYDDLPPSHPCHDSLVRLVRRDILLPTGESRFGPGDPISWEELRSVFPKAAELPVLRKQDGTLPKGLVTRAAVAPMLVAMRHGEDFVPPAAEGIFDDLPPEESNARYVEQLYRDRIAAGVSRKPMRFGADDPLTRCQFVLFVDRTFGIG